MRCVAKNLVVSQKGSVEYKAIDTKHFAADINVGRRVLFLFPILEVMP